MEKPSINLIDTDDLLVSVIERESDFTTFCFTGVGHAIGGVDIQELEFKKSSNNSTTIFVVDRKRSWGNNIDFDQLADLTRPFTNGKIVNTLGNSMGGFLAILLTKYVKTSSCIAFVPQYSVNRNVVPNENRWKEYIDQITNWKYESLADCFPPETNYYLFFGKDFGIEDEQRNMFPETSNVSTFLFQEPDWAHEVAQKLKKSELLYPVIDACFKRLDSQVILSEQLGKLNVGLATSSEGVSKD